LEKHGIAAEIFLRQMLEAVRGRLHSAVEEGRDTTLWTRAIDLLLQALQDVRLSPVPSVVLEGAFLELSLALSSKSSGVVAAGRKESKEEREKTVEKMKREEEGREPVDIEHGKKREDAGSYTARELTVEGVKEAWEELLKKLPAPPSLTMSLKTASVKNVRGNCVELAFSSEFHKGRIEKAEASAIVEEALKKVFGSDVRIACAIEGETLASDDEGAVNLVEAAREVFGK